MNLTLLISALVAIIAGLIWYAFIRRGRFWKTTPSPEGQGFLLLQNQLNELTRALTEQTRNLDQKIGDSSRFMHDSVKNQLSESQKLIKEITVELTEVKATGRQVVGFAEQLQSLQDILKNPKQRGILGEYYLETLLKNVLPVGSYQMQYAFTDGTIVDAVVFVKDKIIPIDSKFSLENYNRLSEERDPARREELERAFRVDLKLRIDETAKYVKPAENTMDFAFMFIPHEAIYYDLLVAQVGSVKVNTRDLIEYAFRDRHVIIVSPTSFLAYLQTVLQGLKALQIEESAKDIHRRVEALGRHLAAYEQYMISLGNALGTSVRQYNHAAKEFKKIDKDVVQISGVGGNLNPPLLDLPAVDE